MARREKLLAVPTVGLGVDLRVRLFSSAFLRLSPRLEIPFVHQTLRVDRVEVVDFPPVGVAVPLSLIFYLPFTTRKLGSDDARSHIRPDSAGCVRIAQLACDRDTLLVIRVRTRMQARKKTLAARRLVLMPVRSTRRRPRRMRQPRLRLREPQG